ncbi:MAG: sialidase family protein, partial [Aristaeellaceae bacterium]
MKTLAYRGREAADPRFHDGALRPVMGACHIQVMRANREHPELSQGTDFTYNHAPMLCRWHGRMYLMYLSSPVHEHDGLANALLTDSPDGLQWSQPRVIFPSLPVPQGIYRGKDADRLPNTAQTVVHHRMGFYRAPNDVLLVMTHHGVTPHLHVIPNSGYGMGRVVRRIHEDGSLGEIYVLRVNTQAGWKKEHFPYPWYEESDDAAFAEACNALLKDHLANGAWWEEERLDEDFFPLKNMRAPSFCPLPDGRVAAIGKVGVAALSEDGGESWTEPARAEGIISSGGKCCITRTGDGRYAILYNPSPDGQHRWPLAVITSEDGYTYDHMLCAGGEVAPMRYGGYLKNFGLNYIRGIMPGNDDAPDGCTWLAYSMNKEDIWVLRLPPTLTGVETEPVRDDFAAMDGPFPPKWHIYSPLWAQVRLEDGCLTLRDSEPWDYAKAVRVFPESRRAEARIRLTVRGGRIGMLHLELS